MKEITLVSTWRGIDGRTLTVRYLTRYAKSGLYDYFYHTRFPSHRIWGTNQSDAGQQIEIGSGSTFSSVVYAPNGDVKIYGDTDVMGAVVARSITMMGSAQFHYDEALANTDGDEPFQIGKWRKISSPLATAYYKALMDRP